MSKSNVPSSTLYSYYSACFSTQQLSPLAIHSLLYFLFVFSSFPHKLEYKFLKGRDLALFTFLSKCLNEALDLVELNKYLMNEKKMNECLGDTC